jgi:hypothetical protein
LTLNQQVAAPNVHHQTQEWSNKPTKNNDQSLEALTRDGVLGSLQHQAGKKTAIADQSQSREK